MLVGRPLSDWTDKNARNKSRRTLAIRNTRVVQYEEIIANAKANYHAYLQREEHANSIAELVNSIRLADLTEFDSIAIPGMKPKPLARDRSKRAQLKK